MGEVIDGKTIEDMNDPALEDEMRTARVMDMMNNIDVSDDEIDAPSDLLLELKKMTTISMRMRYLINFSWKIKINNCNIEFQI